MENFSQTINIFFLLFQLSKPSEVAGRELTAAEAKELEAAAASKEPVIAVIKVIRTAQRIVIAI